MNRLCIALFALLFVAGCASDDITPDDAANLAKSAGGRSDSTAKTGDVNVPIALSQDGNVKVAPVKASATRTVSNSSGGHVQGALTLAGSSGASPEARAHQIETDPVIVELRAELAALREGESTPEERAAVVDKIAARVKELEQAASGPVVSFPALREIHTSNVIINGTGTEEKPLTPEEAAAAAQTIPAIIEKARAGDTDADEAVEDGQ